MSDVNKMISVVSVITLRYYQISALLQIRSSAWLEHYTDNVGVSGSNPDGSTIN